MKTCNYSCDFPGCSQTVKDVDEFPEDWSSFLYYHVCHNHSHINQYQLSQVLKGKEIELEVKCPRCLGSGKRYVEKGKATGFPRKVKVVSKTCRYCNGSGKIDKIFNENNS